VCADTHTQTHTRARTHTHAHTRTHTHAHAGALKRQLDALLSGLQPLCDARARVGLYRLVPTEPPAGVATCHAALQRAAPRYNFAALQQRRAGVVAVGAVAQDCERLL
jgi:hypothetical protein